MRLYSCKIWKRIVSSGVASTDLVREFIPCRNDNTTGLYVGAIGLWDDVNNLFYPNAGTGTFIAGELPTDTHKTLINGTLYTVQGGKCMVNGTVYNILKGRTLIDGTGYDITFGPDVSLTWVINKTPTLITLTTDIGFTSNGKTFNQISISSGLYGSIDFYGPTQRGAVYTSGSWLVGEAYRTITFDEPPTGDLLTWLQANAVQQ